jgi:hypothetical protein
MGSSHDVLAADLQTTVSLNEAGSATPEEVEQLEESYRKWLEAKNGVNGNYLYRVTFSSFSGFRSTTTITATAGEVSERSYVESLPIYFDFAPRDYVESGSELGTNEPGAPAKTLDELYEIARMVLQTPMYPFEMLRLHFDDRGLLDACYIFNTLIADDAPINGVSITGLTLGDGTVEKENPGSDRPKLEGRNSKLPLSPATLRVRMKRLVLDLFSTRQIENPKERLVERRGIKKQLRHISRVLRENR